MKNTLLFAVLLNCTAMAISPEAYDTRRELQRISDILTTHHIIPVFPFRQGLFPGEVHRYAEKPESIYDTSQLEEMSVLNVFALDKNCAEMDHKTLNNSHVSAIADIIETGGLIHRHVLSQYGNQPTYAGLLLETSILQAKQDIEVLKAIETATTVPAVALNNKAKKAINENIIKLRSTPIIEAQNTLLDEYTKLKTASDLTAQRPILATMHTTAKNASTALTKELGDWEKINVARLKKDVASLEDWIKKDKTGYAFKNLDASSTDDDLADFQLVRSFGDKAYKYFEGLDLPNYSFEYVQFPALELNKNSALSLGLNIPALYTSSSFLGQKDVRVVMTIENAFSISYPSNEMLDILVEDALDHDIGLSGVMSGNLMLGRDGTFVYSMIKAEHNTDIARLVSVYKATDVDDETPQGQQTNWREELSAYTADNVLIPIPFLDNLNRDHQEAYIRVPNTVYYSRNFIISIESDSLAQADGDIDFGEIFKFKPVASGYSDIEFKFAAYEKKTGTVTLIGQSAFPLAIGYRGDLYRIGLEQDTLYRPLDYSQFRAMVIKFNKKSEALVKLDKPELIADAQGKIRELLNKPLHTKSSDEDIRAKEAAATYNSLLSVSENDAAELANEMEKILNSPVLKYYKNYVGPPAFSMDKLRFEVPPALPIFNISSITESTELPFHFVKSRFNLRRNPSGSYAR